MKNKFNLDDILRNFSRTIHEELGYPSIASSKPMPIVGLGSPNQPETPEAFQGKLELHDAVDTLFYHFSTSQIISAMADHIQTKAEGMEDDMNERESLMDIVNTLRQSLKKAKV